MRPSICFSSDSSEYLKRILNLGVPIILGQLGIIILGFIDNIMVGQHASLELAAASFVNNFFTLSLIFGMGFSYGLTPLIGALTAKGEKKQAGEMLRNSLYANLFIAVIIVLIMLFLLQHLDWLNQPKELIKYIVPYYKLQLISIPFIMIFNTFKQFCEGTTDTSTPMWILLGSNTLNIIGNYILIYGKFGAPELGLYGAGLSTLAARIISVVIFLIVFKKRKSLQEFFKGFTQSKIRKRNQKQLFQLGLPVAFQMGVETASFSISVVFMGWLGSAALAGHQIVSVLTTLGFMIYYGIGASVSIEVSRWMGLHELQKVKKSVYAGLKLTLIIALAVVILLFTIRNYIGRLFTNDSEIISIVAILCFPVMAYQFGDALQIIFANALRGLGHVKFLAFTAFICHIGLALPIGYICAFVLDWGPLGIWCGFPISLSTLGLLLFWYFNRLMTRTTPPKESPLVMEP